jgi:hypothetical protein
MEVWVLFREQQNFLFDNASGMVIITRHLIVIKHYYIARQE